MTTILNQHSITREQAVRAIATIRSEWEESVSSRSLIEELGSIGLLLFDLASFLEFTMDEQLLALGSKLYRDLEQAGIIQSTAIASSTDDSFLQDSKEMDVVEANAWVPERWSSIDKQ